MTVIFENQRSFMWLEVDEGKELVKEQTLRLNKLEEYKNYFEKVYDIYYINNEIKQQEQEYQQL